MDKLDQLAAEIQCELSWLDKHVTEWAEHALSLCLKLTQARALHGDDDTGFGKWCDGQNFKMNKNDRAAVIAMGKHPERARVILNATKRRSLQLIYRNEFRIPNVRKGAGSTGGNTTRPTPKLDEARAMVRPLVEAGKPVNRRQLAEEHKFSNATIDTALAAEHARLDALREATTVADWTTAPGPVRDKIKAAIDKHRKALDDAFEERVQEQARGMAREMIEGSMLPAWEKELERTLWQIRGRKRLITMKLFNRYRFANHPDTCQHVAADERNALSQKWEELKDVLVGEDENPIAERYRVPTTIEELMKMRAVVTERNSARGKAAAAKRKEGNGAVA